MDTTAHRIIKNARDTLVDGLRLGLNDLGHHPDWPDVWAHGMTTEQAIRLDKIVWQLWDLMDNDPAPPECQECAEPLTQPATGRPRRFCSDACRQRAAYHANPDADVVGPASKEFGRLSATWPPLHD
jgi:hypothetical protein